METTEKKYLYTNVLLDKSNRNSETKTYKSKAKTNFHWEVEFELNKFAEPKTTQSWSVIVWEVITCENDERFPIRQNLDAKGQKRFSATVIKWELFANVQPKITAWDVKTYQVSFVEKNEPISERKASLQNVVDDIPF